MCKDAPRVSTRRFKARHGALTGTLQVVLSIEKQCFADPWGYSGFCQTMAISGVQGWVAEITLNAMPESIAVEIVGYCVFNATTGEIISLAVEPKFHRGGVGTALMSQMIAEKAKQATLWCDVDGGNFPAHQFLKANNFLAISCLTGTHDGAEVDTIRFRHTPIQRGRLPIDRIGKK